MNKQKFYFYLLLLAASRTSSTLADDSNINPIAPSSALQLASDHMPLAPNKQIVTANDLIINKIDTIAYQLIGKLMELATLIGSKQINMSNRETAMRNIQEMVYILQGITQNQFFNASTDTIKHLLNLLNAITLHLEQQINNGMKSFQPFNYQEKVSIAIKKNKINTQRKNSPSKASKTKNDDTLIAKKIDSLGKKIDGLAINNLGIEWYNKAYRSIDTYMIQNIIKYKIAPRTLGIACCLGAASYLWWHFAYVHFMKTMPSTISKKIYGPLPQYSPATGIIDNYHELGILPKADSMASKVLAGLSPIFALLGKQSIAWIANEWEQLSPIAFKKIQYVHNKLKGGSFSEIAHRFDSSFIADVSFDDLIDSKEVIEEFQLIIDYLKNPEVFDRAKLAPHKGILLHGSSRTGKTFAVSALANEIRKQCPQDDFKLIPIDSAIINQYGIQQLVSVFKQHAPCIIFIDEIDMIPLQRGMQGNDTLSQFLTCMSNAFESSDANKQVIIIGATNKPECLDFALRMPGRFGKQIAFKLPNIQNRKEFLNRKFMKLALNPAEFNIEFIAQVTDGLSYQGIEALIKSAIIRAKQNHTMVSQSDIEVVIARELWGIDFNDHSTISPEELSVIAAHFAGRALATHLLPLKEELSCVTIYPVKAKIKEVYAGKHLFEDNKANELYQTGALFTSKKNDSYNVFTHQEKIALCKFLIAGSVAEELLLGQSSYSCGQAERNRALQIALENQLKGLTIDQLSPDLKSAKQAAALSFIETCEQEVKMLLEKHQQTLTLIKNQLQQKRIMYKTDIDKIIALQP